MQQYLVTDDYCNYREVALAMLLWKVKILDLDSIENYQKTIAGSMTASGPQNFQYVRQELSFEDFKLFPGVTKDQ